MYACLFMGLCFFRLEQERAGQGQGSTAPLDPVQLRQFLDGLDSYQATVRAMMGRSGVGRDEEAEIVGRHEPRPHTEEADLWQVVTVELLHALRSRRR